MPTPDLPGVATATAPRPAGVLSDFCVTYPKLEIAQQERFRQTVTRLLAGHVLTPGSAFRPDADWQFADRFGDLIDGYLRLGGWRLEIDRVLRVARVVHDSGEQRVRLGKLESLALCVLRLAYHEQKLVLKEDDLCRVTVGELRERLIHAGVAALDVSKRKLAHALRVLARYHMIDVERGFGGDDEEIVTVARAVEKVLSPERVQAELRTITARRMARDAAAVGGGPAEADGASEMAAPVEDRGDDGDNDNDEDDDGDA